MRILLPLLSLLILAGLSSAQVGGTGDGYMLTTGDPGALTPVDKTVGWNTNLELRLDHASSATNSLPLLLAAEILPGNLPLGTPCINLDGDPVTCEGNLGANLFLLLDPSSTPFPILQPAGGLDLSLHVPPGFFLWQAPHTTFRLQAAVVNPASPIGVSVSNFVDHLVGVQTYALPASDDGYLSLSFDGTFPFYGTSYSAIWFNSNGSVTFGSGDTDYTPTEAELLAGAPRIAPMFADISPNVGGTGTATIVRDAAGALVSATFTYDQIPAFGNQSSLNTFSTILNGDGSIEMDWNGIALSGAGIAGITPGNGSAGPNEVDLTYGTGFAGGPGQAIYEVFAGSGCGEDASDLTGFTGLFVPTGTDSYAFSTPVGSLPTFTSLVSPAFGLSTGGEQVSVVGTNYDVNGTYAVTFGGVPATNVSVVDQCTLTATTPPHPAGEVDVVVSDTNGYVETLTSGFLYLNQPGGSGGNIPLGDDSSASISFTSGSFTYYGVPYTSVWVNANGNLTFGSPSGAFSESPAAMLSGPPRIAMAWDDHHPLVGGSIDYTETATTFTVSFANVPAYTSGSNSYSVTLDKTTGAISMSYGTCTSWNGALAPRSTLVGISAGGGAGVATTIDVNTPSVVVAAQPADALFHWLNAGGAAWGLDGQTITFTPTGGNGIGPYQFSNP